MNDFLSKMVQRFVEYRIWTLVLVIFVSVGCAFFAFENFRINSDLNSLIKPSQELSWHRDNEYFKQQFPMFEQTALIVVSGENVEQVVSTAKAIVHDLKLNQRIDEVFAPTVDGFVHDHRIYFLDIEQLSLWLQGVEYGYGAMLRMADEASLANLVFSLGDHLSANRGLPLPTLLETLVANLSNGKRSISAYPGLTDPEASLHYEIIVVRGERNFDEELPNAELVAILRDHVDNLETHPDVEIRLTGEVLLAHEEISAAFNGIERAGVISIFLLAIILGFGIRSVGFVLSIFALLAVGVVATLALAVAVVGSFNTLSLIFVIMFFGLGVDFAVHFGLRIREAAQGADYADALRIAIKDTGPALFLCMVTSSIAFLSFVPTAYVGLAELGLISAMGMLVAFMLTMVFLPLLLSYVPMKASSHPAKQFESEPGSKKPFLIQRYHKKILLGFTLALLFAGWFAKNMTFDYSVLAMRDSSTEGMQTLLALQDAGITTDYSISVLTKNIQEAQLLTPQLEALTLVGGVLSPDQFLPKDNTLKSKMLQAQFDRYDSIEEVLKGDDDSKALLSASLEYLNESLKYATPSDREDLLDFVFRLENLSATEIKKANQSLPAQIESSLTDLKTILATRPFSESQIPKSFSQRFVTPEGEYLLRVQPQQDIANRESMTAFIEQVSSIAPMVAGRSVVEWGVGGVVVAAFAQATMMALAGIFIVLVLYFRSLILPMLVLVPIGAALVFTFALCQLFGLSLNMANILVVPLIIGLGVDTGIHVVHRATSIESKLWLRTSTARAVLISALTTVGTFFSLSFSPHLGAASIGLLLTVAISLLVVVTFTVLPALIHLFGLDSKQSV